MNGKRFFGLAILVLSCSICSMLISCGAPTTVSRTSTDDVARQSEQLIIERYAERGIAVKIEKPLVLVKRNDTEYRGMVTVSVAGDEVELFVDVLYDGKNIQAEWAEAGSVAPVNESRPSDRDGAQIRDVRIVNRTGFSVYYVYLSPSTDNGWGVDRLGADILTNGQTLYMPPLSGQLYDIRLVDVDGDTYTKYAVRLSSNQAVEFTFADIDR